MNKHFSSFILNNTGATSFSVQELVQELWSGYGKILRLQLNNAPYKNVIVKHVQLPFSQQHPRGWNSNIGHQRKLKSYQVESNWYKDYSHQSNARLPSCIALENYNDEVLIILEDLDQAGYPLRKGSVNWEDISACLNWLATFHASYLGMTPKGLWDIGTYWHLDTRPQELTVLTDKKLKDAAQPINDKLNAATFKTFVHGDAKLANFCFSNDHRISGVDFQYVGGGCGMKDVAYFIGSCLNETECERLEEQILDTYFSFLQKQLKDKNDALEREWRSLYRVAWADFHRFLKGWSPGHWKINSYSERVTAEVIKNL